MNHKKNKCRPYQLLQQQNRTNFIHKNNVHFSLQQISSKSIGVQVDENKVEKVFITNFTPTLAVYNYLFSFRV